MTDWKSTAKPGQHTISDFRFADGRRLDVTLAYHTLGSLDSRAGNAVMLLHGTTGSGQQFLQPSTADFLFGSGQPLDVSKFFVILPDAIGHGRSSRPSDGRVTGLRPGAAARRDTGTAAGGQLHRR
jgi:homoserine O-acetyltransferase/O-succinyltransferase